MSTARQAPDDGSPGTPHRFSAAIPVGSIPIDFDRAELLNATRATHAGAALRVEPRGTG
jgi:hypothetical protein